MSDKKQGRIEVVCGPMFSGKTEELFRRLKRLKYSQTDYLLFKPKIDNRYSDHQVVTHENVAMAAFTFESAQQIYEYCKLNNHIKVIAIDEVQFLPHEVPKGEYHLLKICQLLERQGYRIIVSGLDMDHRGEPFGFIPELMAIADEVLKLKSICFVCGEDATMSFKEKDKDLGIVEIGSTDKYQSRCLAHWIEGMAEKMNPSSSK